MGYKSQLKIKKKNESGTYNFITKNNSKCEHDDEIINLYKKPHIYYSDVFFFNKILV